MNSVVNIDMLFPKVNKSLTCTIARNVSKVVATVLLATSTIGATDVVLASEQCSEVRIQESASTIVQPIVLQQFTQMTLGASYHYSHRSHYSHSSHRSHYSHYSGY